MASHYKDCREQVLHNLVTIHDGLTLAIDKETVPSIRDSLLVQAETLAEKIFDLAAIAEKPVLPTFAEGGFLAGNALLDDRTDVVMKSKEIRDALKQLRPELFGEQEAEE